MKRHVTIPEAAELSGLSERTVRNRIRSGQWESHLQTVRGDGFATQCRMIRTEDIRAEMHPEAPGNSEHPATSGTLAQVGNNLPAAPEDLEGVADLYRQHTAAMNRLASALEDARADRRRRDRLALVVGLPVLLAVGGLVIYTLQSMPS